MHKDGTRKEHDSLGEVLVPAGAQWGAQTQRAAGNFTVSGIRFPRRFIRALAQVKVAAAHVNKELKAIKPDVADAIIKAGAEVAGGQMDGEFPLDIFQTGSGTSTNMNANEVIASRANEILGGARGTPSRSAPMTMLTGRSHQTM